MDRRNFIRVTTATTTAGSLGAAPAPQYKETRTVNYKVQGFTCITCAVGLETMLKGMPGVTRTTASYPERSVSIGFDESAITEKKLKEFISVCGFSVEPHA